jgi:hypothetical protein
MSEHDLLKQAAETIEALCGVLNRAYTEGAFDMRTCEAARSLVKQIKEHKLWNVYRSPGFVPDEPGWYRLQHRKNKEALFVKVDVEGIIRAPESMYGWIASEETGRWAGPIPEPVE